MQPLVTTPAPNNITAILQQFASTGTNRTVDWGQIDLSGIQNTYDREYVRELIGTLRNLDPGNKHLSLGMNLETLQWGFWLINFKGKFTETHFRIIRAVPHAVQGWTPIKDGNIWVKDNSEFGTCLWVIVTPMPASNVLLSGSERPQLQPAPFQFAQPQLQQQPHYQPALPAPPQEEPRRTRDSSPKRTSMFTKALRVLIGPPERDASDDDL
jgi:hypothetical protein